MNKNEYKKISDRCGIAYIQEWGSEHGKMWYVLYAFPEESHDIYGEVWGKGQSEVEALLDGIKNIVEACYQSVPLSYLKHLTAVEILEMIRENEGTPPNPPEPPILPIWTSNFGTDGPVLMPPTKENREKYGVGESPTYVTLPDEENKVYPLLA